MSPHLELAAELEQELEEARDTIERLIAEKAGITSQRDEMKRQLDKAIAENLSLRERSGSGNVKGLPPADTTENDQ